MEMLQRGVWPTMITPYDRSGGVDLGAARAIVDWYREMGVAGVFAVCQSSEMFYLSLDERVRLARAVADQAGEEMGVIASGHVSDGPDAQADELSRLADTGVRAVVLVSNRLAARDEDDDVWIANAERLIARLPGIPLGMYECPHPYKRLLTEKTLRWMAGTGRFAFIKDTCCDAGLMRERVRVLEEEGGQIQLYNANSATALASLRFSAAGFSGVMCNFHADLYVWLCERFRAEPEKAERLQALLTAMSMYESFYPANAKYHMNLVGVPMEVSSRVPGREALSPLEEDMTRQLLRVEELARAVIAG